MADRNFFDPRTAPAKGVGGFDPFAIAAAGSDQRMGFDMLMNYLTGSTDQGTGPFAGFLENFLSPIATSAINALSMISPNGKTPTSIDDLFSHIAAGSGGGATENIYDYLSNLAQQAIGAKMGPGSNMSFDEMQALLRTLNPLTTLGMDNITGHQFQRQQGDLLRSGQTPSYWDMTGNNNRKDWGNFFTNSPFFQQYYGGTKLAPGNTVSPVVAGGSGNLNALLADPVDTRRQQTRSSALAGGGGGGGGLFNPGN